MEIEQMIQLAIVVFLIMMVAFAVIWGPNVPWLLSARQKTYKEIDPNAALNLKSQLWDSCLLSKPKFVDRLVFQGQQFKGDDHAAPSLSEVPFDGEARLFGGAGHGHSVGGSRLDFSGLFGV